MRLWPSCAASWRRSATRTPQRWRLCPHRCAEAAGALCMASLDKPKFMAGGALQKARCSMQRGPTIISLWVAHPLILQTPPALPPAAQLSEAQALAGYSAGEMAELVQQLAEARAERGEAAAKLAEAREEVSRLRSGEAGLQRSSWDCGWVWMSCLRFSCTSGVWPMPAHMAAAPTAISRLPTCRRPRRRAARTH